MNPDNSQVNQAEENRKSSVETEMENYLKSELNSDNRSNQPDVVQTGSNTNTSSSDPDPSVQDIATSTDEAMVTSAIISVDDIDGDINNGDNNDNNAADGDSKEASDLKVDSNNPTIKVVESDNTVDKDTSNNVEKDISDVKSSPSSSPPPISNKSLTPPTKITLPKIQISPESTTSSTDGDRRASSSSLSPSRIPSRKNSNGPSSSSSQSAQSQAINEDLKKLESRLEKFANKSSEGSECSESSDQSGRGSAGVSAVVSRLHSSGTASSRAKTADKSGNTSPQEKTASMLKNTLRKMTRFSIGSNATKKKEQTEENFAKPAVPPEADKSRSRTTFLGKSRVPKSQSPAPGVARSKSFKEPGGGPVTRSGAGGGVTNGNGGMSSNYNSLARNNVYTSSLRRTKMKHKNNEDNDEKDNSTRPTTAPLGRSGTGGLERGAMRRSVSASRGGHGNVMSSSVHNPASSSSSSNNSNKLVKKSRPVQTSLTKDPCHDTPDTDNPGLVNFQVWLPELLGGDGCDIVETQVTDFSEPIDVRKNRALTLENMKLQREVERLRGFQGDNEFLKKEVKSLKIKLEEEQKCRSRIQTDLEQYQDRVKTCMESMDCVERQFESRDLALAQMEGEQARMEDYGLQLRARLGQAEQVIGGQKRELDRSLAAQKTLIHQLQESEQEAREMQEFLQAEKSTLQEALKEGEQEIKRMQDQIRSLETKVTAMENQSHCLSKQLEMKVQEVTGVRQELGAVKDKAREMLLGQGAELSRASVAILSLTSRLETLVPGQSEDVSEVSDTDLTLPPSHLARRSSQFLITPTENLDKSEILSDFSRAMMTTSTGSDSMRVLMTASTGSDQLGGVDTNVPGLTEQIANIETLVAKLVTNNEEMVRSQQENVINGNTETVENNVDKVTELQEIISDKERMMQEMMTKFGRNRQILTNNWEQAESEVRRLDDIYHDTVDRVVMCLAALPELTQTHPSLAKLVNTLQLERESNNVGGEIHGDNENLSNNINGHANKKMSRSLLSNANSSSGEGDITNLMSQSQILSNSNTSGNSGVLLTSLSQSIMSDPGLIKAAAAVSPALTPHLSREDMNANQSL